MAETKRFNARLSEATMRQLEWLAGRGYSDNRTQVVEVAVDRMYNEEMTRMSSNEAYQAAVQRVNDEPQLDHLRGTILYDWPEGDEHWRWVATAPLAEIVDWAELLYGAEKEGNEE